MAWLLQSLGLGATGSPFETLDAVPWKHDWHWKQYQGRRREGGGAVSIFRVKIAELTDQTNPLAKRAFSKTKTMRHPHILNIVEGIESETELEIVTESVTPLLTWLEECEEGMETEQRDACVVWGIRCILEALNFIHSQGLVHGLVAPASIFVTQSGDFKLWGLDLLCNLEVSDDLAFFRAGEGRLATLSGSPQYRSPERCNGEWEKVTKQFAASDVWSLGHTIALLFEGSEIPGELSRAQKKMVSTAVVARPKIARLLASDMFRQHPFVEAMSFIEEMSLKTHPEMVAFFKQLNHPMRFMPTTTRVHKLIPALKSGIERSIGPDKRPEDVREMVGATLPVLSEIGSTMTGEEYRIFVVPAVLPLFSVSDRAVRMQLLERIEGLVKHMDSDTVNGRVFESLNAGFADTAKVLREVSLKSMLSLVDKLNEHNLNDALMRTLAKLQVDPEPSIRTNTTIFYGKVATHLKEGIRVKIIVPAFLKAMKDPFPYARLAAVRATSACKAYFEPQLVAHKILPNVVAMLLDPYGLVREAAFDCVQAFLAPLRLQSDVMKKDEEAKAARAKAEAEAKRIAEGPKVGELSNSPAKQPHRDDGVPSNPSLQTGSTGAPVRAPPLRSGAAVAAPAFSTSARAGSMNLSSAKPDKKKSTSEELRGLGSPGSIGFRTASDSSFWDAIDDEAPPPEGSFTSADWSTTEKALEGGDQSAGWDDAGWGNEGGDGLDDLDDDGEADEGSSMKNAASPSVAGMSGGGHLFGTSAEAKKSVSERKALAAAKKEGQALGGSKKLAASKLPTSGGGDDWEW